MTYEKRWMTCLGFGLLCGLAVGCSDSGRNATDRTNTGVNVRDRDNAAKTPFDQNENKSDIAITADIRREVLAAKLSINAQNVKIVTQSGKVTLRGPVNTQQEKQTIEEIAMHVAGDAKVDSQLEVNQ